jgi:hypothetical protein
MSSVITDEQAVAAAIHGYVKGCETGEGSYLQSAFHPDARMFGAVGAERYDIPIFGGMDQAVADQPTGGHQAEIVSIDMVGDASCVKLSESGFWGQDFTDFFLLSRIDGQWQIVAKAFDHTGPSAG